MYSGSLQTLKNKSLDYQTRKAEIAIEPSKFYPTIRAARRSMEGGTITRIPEFRTRFENHNFLDYANKRYPDETFVIEGKITSIRKSGKAMYFIDLLQDGTQLQIMASNKLINVSVEEFNEIHSRFKRGDFIICHGFASVTNVGELTVKANAPLQLLSPCLKAMPNHLVDRKNINSQRVLNYLVNRDSQIPILVKSWVIQAMRNFFLKKDFIEVQTPILSGPGTGANASPFTTAAHAISSTDIEEAAVQLRVAPELWLKKLVIGGFDRIFEIGNNFRNEGIDATHNPEFTSCEFYQSFISLPDLMKITEEMFKFIHEYLSHKSSTKVPSIASTVSKLNTFTVEFPKFEFLPTLEAKTGIPLPQDLNSANLVEYYEKLNLEVPKNKSPANLLDNLSGIYLESISLEVENTPVFIYNQPAVLSPLAKSSVIEYDGGRAFDISMRFELFINGKEYVNSYEEENSPYEQFKKFKLQQSAREQFKDDEMLIPDWEYIKAMEYGLPPTGGWGCGIDRLAMLFAGVDRIDSVLPFGNLRDVKKQ
ncbi:uncharacterized protein RJT20DRAFT_146423 [Scheffersomyces xylosifermentans]|uniref:uncharacterized protein n=1 Tax=Scheffersomyces xylosifermentans TaxID=1304137 RepID=UPI00315C8A36